MRESRVKKRLIFAMLIASGVSGAAFAAAQTVDQKNLKFSVTELKISRGDSIEFTNSDETSHNITISGGALNLNSGLQTPGASFKVPSLPPGTYRVTCGIHPNMKMTLTVE